MIYADEYSTCSRGYKKCIYISFKKTIIILYSNYGFTSGQSKNNSFMEQHNNASRLFLKTTGA